jgi:hypothetical protein
MIIAKIIVIMKNTVRTISALAMLAAATLGFGKPFARGIIDLPGAISAKKPIGAIGDHPWQNANVAGLRIRIGWDDTETADGVYNWVQIDESLAQAVTSGKFIGLGVMAGLSAPPWLMGGVSFSDGTTILNVATLTSPTANFTSADVGKVIICTNFPTGTTIVSKTSSTVVQTSAAATKETTIKKPAAFSILSRNPGGAAFRVLTFPAEGIMVVPWDPIAKAKWKEYIVALGARYDSNPQFQYLVMSGFQQAGECYLAATPEDIAFFDASAVAAGYTATDDLPAGLVAWEATVKEIVAQYMISFPNTPLLITGARPYGGDSASAGQDAMNDIFAWGVAAYPGRFGIMNSQLHATSATGYYLNAAIYNNHLTQPTGIQFLCAGISDNPDNLPRLSNSTPWGDDPLLSAYDAVNNSLTAGVAIGCGFIEVYEDDVNNPEFQTMLAAQSEALGVPLPPMAPTNLRVMP